MILHNRSQCLCLVPTPPVGWRSWSNARGSSPASWEPTRCPCTTPAAGTAAQGCPALTPHSHAADLQQEYPPNLRSTQIWSLSPGFVSAPLLPRGVRRSCLTMWRSNGEDCRMAQHGGTDQAPGAGAVREEPAATYPRPGAA